jgi:hypothetical protein
VIEGGQRDVREPLDEATPESQKNIASAGFCQAETRPSFWQAGHLTNFGRSSSNHERPHSQRILYICCTATVPHFSSWTSISF